MLKNIVFTTYIIIIGIAISAIILTNNRNKEGLIQFGDNILIEIKNDLLKPKTVKGDLVIVNTKVKKYKEGDIISYITLEDSKGVINTNKIVAITTDSNKQNIYSLKKQSGEIENIDDSCIIGKYQATIPYVGTFLDFMLSKRGFWTITLPPTILLFIYFLIKFLLNLKIRPH